jgi:hypothetical protein
MEKFNRQTNKYKHHRTENNLGIYLSINNIHSEEDCEWVNREKIVGEQEFKTAVGVYRKRSYEQMNKKPTSQI